jgi:hypothetical protein
MFRISRLGRLAAAAVLVASGATVALVAPAGAVNTPITIDCTQQYTELYVENSDTLTVTISGSSCGNVIFDNFGPGLYGTATLDNVALTAGNPVAVANGDVIIFTAPASGGGRNSFSFWPNLGSPPPVASLGINFPTPSGSIVDNGNGTATVTYSGDVLVYLLSAGSTCPDLGNIAGPYEYVLSRENPPQAALAASPALIEDGTMAMTSGGPRSIAAGTYQACMYAGNGPSAALVSDLEVNIGQVAPTTTTTSGTDPVVPAFTG